MIHANFSAATQSSSDYRRCSHVQLFCDGFEACLNRSMCILGVCRLHSTHTSRSRPSIQQKSSTFGFTCKPNKNNSHWTWTTADLDFFRISFSAFDIICHSASIVFLNRCRNHQKSVAVRTSSAKDEQRGVFLKKWNSGAACENVESEFKCRDLFDFGSEFGSLGGIARFLCESLRSHPASV